MRSDGETAPEISEFVTGWLDEIGIATTKKTADDGQLTTIIGKGDYDMFAWGWTPFVDPDPMLSRTSPATRSRATPEDPSNYYNDANYCDPQYDKLYQQQSGAGSRQAGRSSTRCSALPAVGHAPCSIPSPSSRRTGRAGSRGSCASPTKIGSRLPADLADLRRAEAGERLLEAAMTEEAAA